MNIRNRGEFALCAMGLHPAQMGQGGASLSLWKGRTVVPHLPGPPLLLLADSIATMPDKMSDHARIYAR
jgi:hypothetical protein